MVLAHATVARFTVWFILFLALESEALPTSRISSVNLNSDPPFMKHYSEFQISDGIGGNALEEAAAVFSDTFDGVDLSTVPYEIYDQIALAREAAEDAEVELFDPAIEYANDNGDRWTADALEVGKTKNRVLYTMAAMQAFKIRTAQNAANNVSDPDQDEDWEQTGSDLRWIIDADRQNKGKTSMSALSYDLRFDSDLDWANRTKRLRHR